MLPLCLFSCVSLRVTLPRDQGDLGGTLDIVEVLGPLSSSLLGARGLPGALLRADGRMGQATLQASPTRPSNPWELGGQRVEAKLEVAEGPRHKASNGLS